MTEEASGWDDQWGRLFGAVGVTGEGRITAYYKQHSPFHIFAKPDLSPLKELKLYIDNGDDEETLCRSNEELHMLLRERNFNHEFRVRNGGHEFQYWRDALPNGLRFISDAFNGKAYRGDGNILPKPANVSSSVKLTREENYEIVLPEEYKQTQRLYPVVYFVGDFDTQVKEAISTQITRSIKNGLLTPLITVFVRPEVNELVTTVVPAVEKKYRARAGWRFRALLAFEKGGTAALQSALIPETFTSCILFDSPVDMPLLKETVSTNKKMFNRTWLMIVTTDKSSQYASNGEAHILLRDAEIYHEYRVQQGPGGSAWMLGNLKEALDFTQRKIHR
jgi:enterochelin esterase-like enzyme